MPSISLCLIAKNEEHSIGRCLKSAKPFVDQIVVVDTGSTDFTVEIAEEMGAEVYHHLWQDDFALARNKSLEKASGDWILFLDCDEELEAKTAPLLREVVKSENYDGYWVNMVNMFNNKPSTLFQGFRLFRNSPLHRFECPIHEQVLPSVIRNSSPKKIGKSNITIYHYGYENDETTQRNKIERNLRILQKAMQDYGNTGFIPFYIAVEQQKLGNFQKALEFYQQSLQRTDLKESYAPAMVRSMVNCYLVLGQYQDGLVFADKYVKVYPNYTDLVYLKGILYYNLGNTNECLTCMNQCIAMGAPPIQLFSVQGIADEKPREIIFELLAAKLQEGLELVNQSKTSQAFTVINSVFTQLKKTPFEDIYNKMIQTMINKFTGAQ
ncbi:glycosyltransferase [Desulfotomaculum sp. 1211_IL3151]|uniref:glycosyltransferase n=1 Tax=Desulfotomaculum sp. 1211_IL3151 TaxID=3084055 RepID=UPI002FDACC54